MAAIKELIRVESNGTISFGDYTLEAKAKLDNFQYEGGTYKVKTYKDITKLECDELFVYESVPGTAVLNFTKSEEQTSFDVEASTGIQVTLGLAPEAEYEVFVNSESVGCMNTNLGGKLSLSVEMEEQNVANIKIVKK